MDDFSLLCESCGYDLAATPATAPCPECGRPVTDSLPDHRKGTAWQRSAGLFSWALTCGRLLTHPSREFSRLSFARPATSLLATNLLLGGALLVAPWIGVLIGDPARGRGSDSALAQTSAMASSFAIQAVVAAGLLFLLTCLSLLALGAFARARQWRLTRRAAWNVACHASIGWLLAGLLPFFFLATWYTVGTLLKVQVNGAIHPRGMSLSWQTVIGAAAPLLGFTLGSAVFLSRLLTGARLCRFAAIPRPAGQNS